MKNEMTYTLASLKQDMHDAYLELKCAIAAHEEKEVVTQLRKEFVEAREVYENVRDGLEG